MTINPDPPFGRPFRPAHDAQGPATLAELAAAGRGSAGIGRISSPSKRHLAELTGPQLDVLQMADNPSACVSQNGSTGVTRPIIKALVAKGYGRAVFDATRRYLIIGFEINDAGRRAVRAARGVPGWVGQA